uniref:Pyruvate formate lyase-activating protein n=1 Tax=Desulfobacca acetoxidans TaxID=60893 RepID=A0A7C5ELE6_9BACT
MFRGPLLAVDVGGGTQDLFLWEPGQRVENAVKLVLPAPTVVVARRLRRLTASRKPAFLTGRLMGGGALTGAVRQHLNQGLPIYAHPQAALTLNDNLDRIRQCGVVITDVPPPGADSLVLGDVDLEALRHLLAACEVPFPRHFAVAVQDHGFSPDASNREFRFRKWQEVLEQGGKLGDLAYFEPPACFTRMRAVAEALPGALIMDTCSAGMRGALLDPEAAKHREAGLTVVNVGNAHTFAALVKGDRLFGIYEHHTGLLTPAKLADHLDRFQKGRLKHEEVFADQGHGCAIHPDYHRLTPFRFTVITGPQRKLARDWPGVFAAPLGDMMLTGCFGLADAWLEKNQLPRPWEADC